MPAINLTLTDTQQQLMLAVIKVSNVNVDFDEVAKEIGGNTNAKKCRDNWYILRKKLMASSADAGTSTPKKIATPKSKVTATPKKRKNGDEETPSKKSKKAATPASEGEGDDEGKGKVKPDPVDEEDELV